MQGHGDRVVGSSFIFTLLMHDFECSRIDACALDVVSMLPMCLTYLTVLTFNMLGHAVRSVVVHQWIVLLDIANNGAVCISTA